MKDAKKVNVQAVNAMLKSKGVPTRLRQGAGYYYFIKGRGWEPLNWPATSVYVAHVDQLTLDQWWDAHQELANA